MDGSQKKRRYARSNLKQMRTERSALLRRVQSEDQSATQLLAKRRELAEKMAAIEKQLEASGLHRTQYLNQFDELERRISEAEMQMDA